MTRNESDINASSNSIAILGKAYDAANVCLSRVLQNKADGAVLLLDYTGRGAMALDGPASANLLKDQIAWYDLADRLCPVCMFQLERSEHFRSILSNVLKGLRKISRINISDETLSWACEAAYNLSGNGTVGLGALLRSLSSYEVRAWFGNTQKDPKDLQQFLDMLKWALGFPAVYGISEGNNKANILKDLNRNSIIWLECRSEHLEREEHMFVTVLVEGAIENYIRTSRETQSGKSNRPAAITIVHLFPPSITCSDIPPWVKETMGEITHIYVDSLHANRSLPQLSLNWIASSSSLWVIGEKLDLKNSIHGVWLNHLQIDEINRMEPGQLWVYSKEKDKSVVARVGSGAAELNGSNRYRRRSAGRRKPALIRQMSTAITRNIERESEGQRLYQKLCDRDILRLGWLKVKSGATKSHGVDGITIDKFKDNLEDELMKLAKELEGKSYRCKPLRRIRLTKPDGGERQIGIACVRDRVVQSACLTLLEPIFEAGFNSHSFAFRPRRNAHQAVAFVKCRIAEGFKWAVIADIKGCFDNIDHDLLLEMISKSVRDPAIHNLIKLWLSGDVLDFHDILPILIGVPQGESLSPLLANIYLTPLDRHFEEKGLNFVRYADDIIVFAKSEDDAKKALNEMEQFLRSRLKLELKPSKTNYVPVESGFDFLGFSINHAEVKVRSKKIESIQLVLFRFIKKLGYTGSTLQEDISLITRFNSIIRGVREYFSLPNEEQIAGQMRQLDEYVDQTANFYLPAKLRDDPAWICRERFYTNKPSGTVVTPYAESRVNAGNGYPEIADNAGPVDWLIKDDGAEESLKESKYSAAIGSEDKDHKAEADNHDASIVTYANRLYIFVHGSFLTLSDNDVVIKKGKAEIFRSALNDHELLFLQGYGINISVALQLRMAELNIPVVFAPPVGEPLAVLNPLGSRKSFLRGSQVLMRDNPDVIRGGLDMLAAKIGNQAAVLKYFSKYKMRPGQKNKDKMKEAADEIRNLAENLRMLDPARAAVRTSAMGFEGQAASIYWKQVGQIIPERFEFRGRVTRSASDPVNQCINYTYGMLYGEIWRAIAKEGLNPYFGIMHGAERNNGSLVFDLIEEFRAPFADRIVLGMLGRGFQPEIGDHGYLKSRSKRQLAVSFSKRWNRVIPWRSQKISPDGILQKQAKNLAGLFKGDGVYRPFKMRW